MDEVKEFSGAIRRLITEAGRLVVSNGGKAFPAAFRETIIAAVQEYNHKATLANTGEILISSDDFR